ncbi:diguanylate cyclase [Candidatus Competibacter phosphatis]|uniref:Diguanylate cyclase n=1 Tax=Candidatus Competibacter phosphatis TaxID=221280 RepID=A0ABX1TFJ9_9GAMM|nr:diguanylate cyclase [Candidatus Competibacter phosphatis]NMQ18146.1 diguanylate cyclase [Candidatus Competibacter phosphatis]
MAFFLSLKWKALLLSSVALVVVTGALVTINYIELRNQFEQRRAESQNQYARQVQGLLEQSSKQLRQWSTIIASLLRTHVDSIDPNQKQMIATFEHLAAVLELDLGMESIALVSSSNHFLAMHGLEPGSSTWTTLAQVSRQVATTESPASLLDCSETCLQYAIVPILGVGGTLVLGLSLADIVLDFQQVSGTDLGLLVEQTRKTSKNGDDERWLQQWGVKIAALSNMRTNIEILRIATRENTLSDSAKQSVYININNREFEVRLFPLVGFGEWTDAYLVIVADVSDAMVKIRSALQRNITLGTIGLILSELLLLAILWAPMSRLRRAAANLPWLADGAFSKVREAITATRQTQFFRDEVSVLNDTAIALSLQLEVLNDEAVERTRDLSKRMTEITQQRNFVNHILETAQTIILTQDRFNNILRINPYGLMITGYSLAELKERPFITLLSYKESADNIQEKLSELVSGMREHVEMECDLYCHDRSIRNVIWYHSRLKNQIDDDPIILSVGMDITARKNAELRLAWLADHDPLTGLYNRRRFEHELKEAIATAKRYRHSGALLFLDVDQFKYINDTSGHGAGDRLLQRLGELFPSILREVDVIGRLGGDEFAVILTQATSEEAVQVTRKNSC